MWRYLIWISAIIGLLIVLIFLLTPNNSGKVPPKTLVSFASSNAVARLTIDGPENSEQQHQSISISVSNQSVTFQQMSGYEDQVVNLQTYTNNQASYNVFLHAIALAGFTRGNTSSSDSDESGYCPLGDRYIVDFSQNGNELERFWTTSCGGQGTYGGNIDSTLALFKAQVPDYTKLVEYVTF